MAKRGRKPILKDKRTTCVTVEGEDLDYLKDEGKEVSEFLRECIAAYRKSKSSPIEQLKKDIEETKATIMGYEIILNQQETRLKELEELAEIESEEDKIQEEFEEKRKAYVAGSTKMMRDSSWYAWNKHLMDAWKFSTLDEAKEYVKETWLEVGVPETRIDKFFGVK